jgi:hypothetical protein
MDLAVENAVQVRHYQRGDFVRHLLPEMEALELDPRLTWVVEKDGMIVAALVALYGSQMAVLVRLIASSDAPPTWLLALLRYATRDLEEMGAKCIIASLSVDQLAGMKLARMFQLAGGTLQPISGFIGAVAIENTWRRW